MNRDVQTEDEVKTEDDEEASPTERRVMRVVLWGIVAVMAVAWIFLFYNVASRTLFPSPTPAPVAKAPPAAPAKPEPAKPPVPTSAVTAPAQPPAVGSPVPGSSPSLVVDGPAANATVPGTFTIVGWAIDLGAPEGTGVDAVAVWATPASGGDAKLLGVAQYGIERPDIGRVFGDRFTRSGYTLSATGLTPGAWNLSVYLHSTVTKGFTSSLTIPVTVQ